jgi:hypothetical protein
MARLLRPALIAALACLALPAGASAARPTGLTATVGQRGVDLHWDPVTVADGVENAEVVVRRDGYKVGEADAADTSYSDENYIWPGARYRYTIETVGTRDGDTVRSERSKKAVVELPPYFVGAATEDITPTGVVNLGGFGLGDGSLFPDAAIGRGGQGQAVNERIKARAIVFGDGNETIAIANIETQGMFAAYEDGPYGLHDMAEQVAKDIHGLPADHILIASDHTHSGPDTIGAWGGVPEAYLKYIKEQTVKAIEAAYADRRLADVRAGHSDASDLVYNQACSEALNQSKTPDYPGPDACATPGKDGFFRVVQATDANGQVIATYTAYAAHATAGGGNGVHGDWPQFLSDRMSTAFGGVGIAMEGANGGTQPCRTACAFTDPKNPGYNVGDRKTALMLNYMAHVDDALSRTQPVRGPVTAAQGAIREPITGPAVTALFMAGQHGGARLLRSHESPWVVGQTIRTITSALRVGGVLFSGTPGEGFPAIGEGVRSSVIGAQEVIQLGLANDQLGYLIAPVSYVPVIAGEVAVNDNIIFNVSPTIGDHVMCSDISLALAIGFRGESPATCAPYDAADAAGDPVGEVPVGGVILP